MLTAEVKTISIYRNTSIEPSFNMAFDELMLASEAYKNGVVFGFWQDSPCVIIGMNQVAEHEVDVDFVRANGIPVVRRMTGGGAVYHDAGNLNFSFFFPTGSISGADSITGAGFATGAASSSAVPASGATPSSAVPDVFAAPASGAGLATGAASSSAVPASGATPSSAAPVREIEGGNAAFELVYGIMREAFLNLGLNIEKSPTNDLLFEGRKFSGMAQRVLNGRMLVHGTILYDVDFDMLAKVLGNPLGKFNQKRGVKSRHAEVVNLKPYLKNIPDIAALQLRLETFLKERYHAREMETGGDFLREVQALANEKYKPCVILD